MKKKTFKELYETLPNETPKGQFIKRISSVTMKSEVTVRMWLSGRQKPDALTQKQIESELKVSADILFPQN